ncbi:hypothetical protein VTJ49DRAFT_7158 [Mycothermus thermophilus]|uniref:Uncharacterized protein n=1 Tax=Humicola insolens TaxID=85995 RepID=A0ABR3VK86_HUMIN
MQAVGHYGATCDMLLPVTGHQLLILAPWIADPARYDARRPSILPGRVLSISGFESSLTLSKSSGGSNSNRKLAVEARSGRVATVRRNRAMPVAQLRARLGDGCLGVVSKASSPQPIKPGGLCGSKSG